MKEKHTMYETVVFDLDGTLLDTLDDLWAAVNAALLKFGFPPRRKDEVRAFVGNGVKKLMQRAIGYETPLFEETFAEFKSYYAAHCTDETRPYAGITPLLTELKKRGIKTAVLSNKSDAAVKVLAKEYFDGLLQSAAGENESAGIRKKPAPDSLFSVLKELGAEKKSTVYIGDSEVDIQTAANAGVDCISVTWGFKDRGFLIKNGGKVLVDDPSEILKFCRE